MNEFNLMPHQGRPVHRTTTGHLSPDLAELTEETLSQGGLSVLPSILIHQIEEFQRLHGTLPRPYGEDDKELNAITFPPGDSRCFYDGDDGE